MHTNPPNESAQNAPIKYENLPLVEVDYAWVVRRPLYYPRNDFAHRLCQLMGRKSFTENEIKHLKEMGFSIKSEIRPPKGLEQANKLLYGEGE
jgi:hypothetical protein